MKLQKRLQKIKTSTVSKVVIRSPKPHDSKKGKKMTLEKKRGKKSTLKKKGKIDFQRKREKNDFKI